MSPRTPHAEVVKQFGRLPRTKDFAKQFSLRRFAGPELHTEQLSHVRIAHLTDIHVGLVTPMEVQLEAVRLTNESQPDAIVITGDFVCHSQLYLDELVYVLSSFSAPIFAVLGNHDHWSGAGEVRAAIKKAHNVTLLDNAWTEHSFRGERLQFVGVDDAYTGHADVLQATKGLDPKIASLGLSHIAEEADRFWERGVPLVLSGHTHAGQVTLAKLHELAIGKIFGHRYVHGLYGSRGREQGAVYVGAGVGASVVPLRVGERGRREVTIFELGHTPGSFIEHHSEQAPLPGRQPSPKTISKRMLNVEKKEQRRAQKRR